MATDPSWPPATTATTLTWIRRTVTDAELFDRLARLTAVQGPRRHILAGMVAAVGLLRDGVLWPNSTRAKHGRAHSPHRQHHQRRQKVDGTRNSRAGHRAQAADASCGSWITPCGVPVTPVAANKRSGSCADFFHYMEVTGISTLEGNPPSPPVPGMGGATYFHFTIEYSLPSVILAASLAHATKHKGKKRHKHKSPPPPPPLPTTGSYHVKPSQPVIFTYKGQPTIYALDWCGASGAACVAASQGWRERIGAHECLHVGFGYEVIQDWRARDPEDFDGYGETIAAATTNLYAAIEIEKNNQLAEMKQAFKDKGDALDAVQVVPAPVCCGDTCCAACQECADSATGACEAVTCPPDFTCNPDTANCECPLGHEPCRDKCCGVCEDCIAGACSRRVCPSGQACHPTSGVCLPTTCDPSCTDDEVCEFGFCVCHCEAWLACEDAAVQAETDCFAACGVLVGCAVECSLHAAEAIRVCTAAAPRCCCPNCGVPI